MAENEVTANIVKDARHYTDGSLNKYWFDCWVSQIVEATGVNAYTDCLAFLFSRAMLTINIGGQEEFHKMGRGDLASDLNRYIGTGCSHEQAVDFVLTWQPEAYGVLLGDLYKMQAVLVKLGKQL